MTPSQLRLARILFSMSQTDLSEASTVARATINRYESGKPVREGMVRLMRIALESAGAVFIPDGTFVDGVPLVDGVGRRLDLASAPPIMGGEADLPRPPSTEMD